MSRTKRIYTLQTLCSIVKNNKRITWLLQHTQPGLNPLRPRQWTEVRSMLMTVIWTQDLAHICSMTEAESFKICSFLTNPVMLTSQSPELKADCLCHSNWSHILGILLWECVVVHQARVEQNNAIRWHIRSHNDIFIVENKATGRPQMGSNMVQFPGVCLLVRAWNHSSSTMFLATLK